MTQMHLLTEDDTTQVFGDAPASPGGIEWEAQACETRIGYLEAIVKYNQGELERERARLRFLREGRA